MMPDSSGAAARRCQFRRDELHESLIHFDLGEFAELVPPEWDSAAATKGCRIDAGCVASRLRNQCIRKPVKLFWDIFQRLAQEL